LFQSFLHLKKDLKTINPPGNTDGFITNKIFVNNDAYSAGVSAGASAAGVSAGASVAAASSAGASAAASTAGAGASLTATFFKCALQNLQIFTV
jgi:hypothetical protein